MSGGGKQMRKFSGFAFALRRCMWKEKKSGLIVKGMWGMGVKKILTACINPYNQPIHTTDIFIWKESIFFLKRTVYCEKALPVDGQSEFVLPGDRFSLHHLLPANATERHCWGTLPGYHVLFLLWLYPSMVVCAGLSMPLRAGVTCEGFLLSK